MNSSSKSGCIIFRDYENLSKAGAGGYGLVLKAKKKNESFFSAIKLIPMDMPTMGRQTLCEAQKVSGITSHDSIVSCLDYWEDEFTKADHDTFIRLIKPKKTEPFYYFPTNARQMNFLCIRMEFCENGNLKQWLKSRGSSIDVWENIQIFLQIARGVEHIHAHKLIHRDLKPANILFFKKNAKISDFGWSATHNVGEYQHTPRAGSALYQTPEQAFGKYGQSTDYYALGLILYELFHPDAQKNVGEALTSLKYTREIPSEIRRQYPIIAELISKLISVVPTDRPNCDRIVTTIRPLIKALKPKPEIGITQNRCNRCAVSLLGTRYKCTICPKFFLCESCEKYDEDHCTKHNFLKLKDEHSPNNGDGCEHYRRKCKLKCPLPECGSANGFFGCRVCHDQDIKGHKMDRFSVKEILCTQCGGQQFPRSACLFCKTSFAEYFCSICNLFDDSEEAKLIYHCYRCGICRKKANEALQYTHCDNCFMCYPSSLLLEDGESVSDDSFFKHECKKEAGKIPCSVCQKDIHNSREPAVLADCHHYVHQSCKTTFPNHVGNCPLCGCW
ncbi:uncharacterized protein LOC119073412 [Bradysia coprophila]|uniref:uncharacterized protein LOC119073412 n=1 Tax=Bradysia coprophila TaxID=38358 RepID=UPI00187DD68E|nr:uncharacterized protein LOC119073412 [Bradysia coprophila]